jgi:hypothetical protein
MLNLRVLAEFSLFERHSWGDYAQCFSLFNSSSCILSASTKREIKLRSLLEIDPEDLTDAIFSSKRCLEKVWGGNI